MIQFSDGDVLILRHWLDLTLRLTVASVQSFARGSASGSASVSASYSRLYPCNQLRLSVPFSSCSCIVEFQRRYRVLPVLLLNGPIRIFHAGHGKSLLAHWKAVSETDIFAVGRRVAIKKVNKKRSFREYCN